MVKLFFAVLALFLATLACSWSDIAPPSAPIIEPSPLPTFAISTLTPPPTETAFPTPTSTPNVPVAWPKDLGVHCRFGPGQEWEAVSSLPDGTATEIKGRTVDTSWWNVIDPMNPDDLCWVAYDVVDTAGNLNTIPIVQPPLASVTAVTVDALVVFTVCGGSNQVTFNGAITANGATTVTYHWEVSGSTQMTTPDESIEFTTSGKKSLTYTSFSADCGEYTVKLVVTQPNEIFSGKSFQIQQP